MTKKAETPAVEKTATVAQKPAETPAKTLKTEIEITKPFLDKIEDVPRNAGDIVKLDAERANYIVSQGFAVIVK